jgi:signal transduction histidine kinase
LSRVATNPLYKIKDAALKIRNKNYDVKLILTGPSEYKPIIESLNEMTKSLKLHEVLAKEHIRELEQIDEQKGEFAAMASHELKTPLVPIKGYLEMLLEEGLIGELGAKQKEVLEKIYQNTELLEKLILRILTAQRLGLGQMKWNLSGFDVFDLMDNVHDSNKSLMSEKRIKFTNLTKDSIMIEADYDQLLQIFSNLIRNSVDFTSTNPEIEILAEKKSDEILFSVKDNGVGMDKESQKHLCKKFYQVDTTVRRKHGGTGLGLSICKGLVEGMGGKIWVQSELGTGSTFYFTIPIKSKIAK